MTKLTTLFLVLLELFTLAVCGGHDSGGHGYGVTKGRGQHD